jgi:hypothetical protein
MMMSGAAVGQSQGANMPKQPPCPPVLIFVEKLADQRFIEGMFREELEAGLIQVEPCYSASGVTSAAQRALLDANSEQVVLVLNAETENPAALEEDVRGPIRRLLDPIKKGGWHLAIAAPRLDAWALADGRIAQAFAEAQRGRGQSSYKERSLQFEKLTAEAGFERKAAKRKFADFKSLAECIEEHTARGGSRAAAAIKARQAAPRESPASQHK